MNVHRNLFTKSFAASLIFRQILVFLCVPVPRTSSAQTSSGFQKDSWLSTVKAPIPGMGEDWGIPSHGEVQKSPEKPKVPMTIKLKRPIWQFCFDQSSRHFKYPFPETLPAWCIYIYMYDNTNMQYILLPIFRILPPYMYWYIAWFIDDHWSRYMVHIVICQNTKCNHTITLTIGCSTYWPVRRMVAAAATAIGSDTIPFDIRTSAYPSSTSIGSGWSHPFNSSPLCCCNMFLQVMVGKDGPCNQLRLCVFLSCLGGNDDC